MKVLSIKGNKVNFDMSDEEYNTLFRHGLQSWINKEFGKNKIRVLPVDKNIPTNGTVFEVTDDFSNECVQIAVIDAIKLGIKESKISKKVKK